MPEQLPDIIPDELDQEEKEVEQSQEFQDAWAIAREARTKLKEDRIEFVRRLMIRHISDIPTIIRLLHEKELKEGLGLDPISEHTAVRYRAIVNKRNRDEANNPLMRMTIAEVVADHERTTEEIIREMWVQYHAEKSATGKKAILRDINNIKNMWIKTLQSVGLAEQAPTKIQYLDKDGKPADAPITNLMQLNQQFNQFIAHNYKDPVAIKPQEPNGH